MNPAALQSFAALSIGVGKWLSQFAIVYLWLLAALSLFEPTRGYTDRLNGYILQPFVSLATRLAATLPIAVVVGIAVLVVALVFRVIGIFFEGVREGATSLSWMPPDLARPTSVLVRAGLLLTTFVFLAPVLTGHPDGSLARAGMVALGAILLGCVPLVATAIMGIVVVYGRRVRAGEYVEIGEHAGKVIDVSLLDITLDDDDGAETRIPHLSGLTRALRVIGAEPRVTIQVGVERARANAELREQLLRVIAPIGLDPRAEVVGIERDDVHFSLSVVTEDLDARSRLHLAALEALDGKSPLVQATPLELELADSSSSADRSSGAPPASGRPSSMPPGGRR
jgi:small-conductance mechanosensitive channel